MSIQFQVVNTTPNPDVVLSTRTIPDSSIAQIQQVFPGTASQTADAAQLFMLKALRDHCRDVIRATARQNAAPAIQTADNTAASAFDADFPVVV